MFVFPIYGSERGLWLFFESWKEWCSDMMTSDTVYFGRVCVVRKNKNMEAL